MKLIVGLGNPGKEYEKTRHNVGFMILDKFSEEVFRMEKKFKAEVFKNNKFVLLKPQTFMNNSGESVLSAMSFYKISLEDLLVIHDDVDLPLGVIKVSKGEGFAGHKGVFSVMEKLGTKDFWRLRIGVESPLRGKMETDNFVLANFSQEEKFLLNKVIVKVATLLKDFTQGEELKQEKVGVDNG